MKTYPVRRGSSNPSGFNAYYADQRAANARLTQITLTMENQQVASSFQNRAIGCLNGGVASGGSVCRHKGAVARAERRVGGVQLVAAILVMYPWGSVKVLSRRERCCIQHSESSFLPEVVARATK
ncbi:hypothetical protein QLX08_010610 [Tetragonisca angustula]|uniref:Uncharacterized protein n=1 Tax=Tetragonisca angustula TaxID=166442 RepID=A0AAW0ZBG0_9HYME